MKKSFFLGLNVAVLMFSAPLYAEVFDFLGVEEPRMAEEPKVDDAKEAAVVPQGFKKFKKSEAKVEPIKNGVKTGVKIIPAEVFEELEVLKAMEIKQKPKVRKPVKKQVEEVKVEEKIFETKEDDSDIEYAEESSYLKKNDLSIEDDGFVGGYIRDMEDAYNARESAADLLAKKPQKLLIEMKPHTEEKIYYDEEEEMEEESENKLTEALSDEQENVKDENLPQEMNKVEENVEVVQPVEKTEEVKVEEKEISAEKEVKEEKIAAEPVAEKQPAVVDKAPFDLIWGSSKQEVEATGAVLEAVEREGYENVWKIKSGPQQNNRFAEITLIFGKKDKLWCIYAESKAIEDDSEASKILELYHKYYEALKKKYGNAEEFFTPYQHKVSQTDENGQEVVEVKYSTIGGEGFLQEIAEEKSTLYATFYDDKVGATLSVAADGNKDYLVLDYKNLPLMNEEKKEKINEMLEDLEGL